jgi:predicted esterase
MQLPPEYNPLREYPCIVALHESRAAAESQIDWWAGPYSEQTQSRLGHASRHGFIVVAPVWSRAAQRTYEYTPQEHERVLAAVRDAMRRASIDSDRVFITGHGEGATAAWDMALAHPDLWAGMIAISGTPSKTVAHYESNARYLPLYMVMGEKDGSGKGSSSIIDSYMSFNHDAMVVMYRGRGREYFYDEIHRLFEWMQLPANKRREIPRDIEAATMRNGDQFFWWLELGELKPDVAIDPILWDQAKRIRAGKISASIGNGNQIRIAGPTEQFKVLLRPQPGIDLNDEVIVRYGSRPRRFQYDGSLKGMLEDARQRADRKRPFWVTFQVP